MRSVMDSTDPWILTTSIAVLVVALVALYWTLERRKLPPGPVAWPVVGSFPAISGALPHHALRALAAKYGSLMFLRLVAEELFRHHDANFLDRPRPMGWDVVTDSGKDLIFANGIYWQQLRKVCISELFTVKRQASYQGVRTDKIQTRLREIVAAAEQDVPIDVKDWLQHLTLNNMTRMTTNKRVYGDGTESKDREDFDFLMTDLIKQLGAFLISDYVPYLGFITKLQGWRKTFNDLRAQYGDVTERIFEIEKHRQRVKERQADIDESHVPDFVDLLLQTPLKDGEPLPDRNINLVLGNMLGAGSETIATTVEWAMAELMLHPKLMARLQSELDAVVGTGNRLVQESDIPNLPFLQAVVKETFRIHPPVTLNLPREAIEAFTFRGYKLPKQTRLLVNFYAIHRDPDVYEDPDAFNPDRFVDCGPKVDHLSAFDSYALTPFSAGRRMCPTSSLGNMMVHAILAHLVHSFEWRMPDGVTPRT